MGGYLWQSIHGGRQTKRWKGLAFNSAFNSDLILLKNEIREPGIGRTTMTGETTTMTWETNVREEEHVPAPFCLQWITHEVATWWKKFTSVSNDAKEKN